MLTAFVSGSKNTRSYTRKGLAGPVFIYSVLPAYDLNVCTCFVAQSPEETYAKPVKR